LGLGLQPLAEVQTGLLTPEEVVVAPDKIQNNGGVVVGEMVDGPEHKATQNYPKCSTPKCNKRDNRTLSGRGYMNHSKVSVKRTPLNKAA
jgi:hypothetical protein